MAKILYDTKYLQLKSTTSKSGSQWVYAHRPNAKDVVVILPIMEDEVLFLIEERPPISAENIGKYSIALPAGLVGDERVGESVEDAIKSELLEETGLTAKEVEIKSRKVASSPGCVSEIITIALAKIETKQTIQPPISDGGIIIDRVWVKKEKIKNWLSELEEKGYILTAQTLAALYYLT
jgi:ADP-ribose pyrophosphatase